ncbi:MAG: sporulation transcriptional regulator SpoIIID [Firmicutes bacterium]|nr:sporulation transcriptional regulator SpoIIID [Bacillota bacterium]
MREHLRERVPTLSDHIIESGATALRTAAKYGVSKAPYMAVMTENGSFG